MSSFDLHLHTNWSYDAFSAVSDYFRFASAKSLRAIAFTDHHLMDAYDEVLECAVRFPEVPFFAGSEVTVNTPFGPMDIVCLNLPVKPTEELNRTFDFYRQWQLDFGAALSEKLCSLGIPLDDAARMEFLKSYRPVPAIKKQGNTHIAFEKLVEYCRKNSDLIPDAQALSKIWYEVNDVYPYPAYDLILPRLKAEGGVFFIAHPFGYFQKNDRKRMDHLREILMLDGIECAHPHIPAEMTVVYRQYCLEHNLLSSAGSDLHSPDFEKFAALDAPDVWLDEILERVTLHRGC